MWQIILIILAYAVVLWGGNYALTLGSQAGTVFLLWLPYVFGRRRGSWLAGLLSGVVGGIAVILFGYGVFRLLVGPGSYTLFPLLASLAPMVICLQNDYRHAKDVTQAYGEIQSPEVVAEFSPMTSFANTSWIGELVGLVVGAVWLFTH